MSLLTVSDWLPIYPTEETAPQEFVVADQRLFTGMRELDNIFHALIDYV